MGRRLSIGESCGECGGDSVSDAFGVCRISQELLGQLAHRGETFSPDRIPVATMRGIILSVKDRTITGSHSPSSPTSNLE